MLDTENDIDSLPENTNKQQPQYLKKKKQNNKDPKLVKQFSSTLQI